YVLQQYEPGVGVFGHRNTNNRDEGPAPGDPSGIKVVNPPPPRPGGGGPARGWMRPAMARTC
ncbi:hypothetical protein LWS69_15000, partial [Bordetella hinzii]|nr:hypothetical protein [Bordetella hinzii]